MSHGDEQGQRYWYSRLPKGSLGLTLVILGAVAARAHESAPKAVASASRATKPCRGR